MATVHVANNHFYDNKIAQHKQYIKPNTLTKAIRTKGNDDFKQLLDVVPWVVKLVSFEMAH